NVAPHFVPLEGCSIGRRVVWPEQRVYGVELRVDGRLDAGQVVSFAYRVELSAQATDMTAVVYSLPRRANDVLIEAEFRGDRRPVDCQRYQRTEAGETTAAVRLDRRDRLQVSAARFGPGRLGLRWAWEDDCGDETDGADGDENRVGEGNDPIACPPGPGGGPRRGRSPRRILGLSIRPHRRCGPMGFSGQNIVVGYDDTTAAMAAVRWAADLARSTRSGIHLVHAWTWPLLGQGMSGIPLLDPTGPRHQAMRLLDDAAERVATGFPDVPVTSELLPGTPREALEEISERTDLLVVGTRGLGPVLGSLLGSVSRGILHDAGCPVAVIRSDEHRAGPVLVLGSASCREGM